MTIPMTINGRSVGTTVTFDVVNPATGEVFAQAPECSQQQLDEAMTAAAAAQLEWGRPETDRRSALLKVAEVLIQHSDELAALLTQEQGKPLGDSAGEVAVSAQFLDYFSSFDLAPQVIRDDSAATVRIIRNPVGVVAAITPWNFPLGLAFQKIAPALAAGNSVVIKPSPYTPLTTLRVGQLLHDVLPPGVLNVLSGGDWLGAAMTTHPTPRKVTFTGSVETGKLVAAATAPDLKRVTLELGGNDAAVVLDDADVPTIAGDIFWYGFFNNGQVCTGIKRVLVPRAKERELIDALIDRARAARCGDPTDPATQLGPINNRAQLERVDELLEAARADGARIETGGSRGHGPGYFYQPTVVTSIEPGSRLVDEEQFGPAMPVIAYDDLDEAVRIANDTTFGLGGSVWSDDIERASQVAARLQSGTVWVNSHAQLPMEHPFRGAKWSGMGVELGQWGLEALTEPQVVFATRNRSYGFPIA
jgi:acyl-CoA reductase-like NAD-dependent aldehyde dehydrogenase